MTDVPLLSDQGIRYVAFGQVFCTVLLGLCGMIQSPDIFLIILLVLCSCGNYAWLMHVDSGWVSENAMKMFQFSFWFGAVSLVVTVYRRIMHPELVPKSDDDSDDDDEDDDGGDPAATERRRLLQAESEKVFLGEGRDRRATTIGDVKKKDATVKELANTFISGISGQMFLKKRVNNKKASKEH